MSPNSSLAEPGPGGAGRAPGQGGAAPGPAGDDLGLIAARFGAELRAAGVPADPGRCERFAGAVAVARPVTVSGLYLCALATLVASKEHIETLRRVFDAMFGTRPGEPPVGYGPPPRQDRTRPEQGRSPESDVLRDATRAAQVHALRLIGEGERPAKIDEEGDPGDELAAREVFASATERLASTDFAELSPAELLMLSGLMRKLTLAVPLRRSRRPQQTQRGRQTDLRRTLRQARRTGGHPLRLARRAPLRGPRRLGVLWGSSGSMRPDRRARLRL